MLVLVFIAGLCEYSVGVLVPLAADARGASNTWVGVLVGAPQLMLVLTMIPSTHWVTSWRRRTVLALGTGLQGVGALGHAAIPNPSGMLLAQLFLGLGLALFWPAYLSYFGSIVHGDAANEWQGRRAAVEGVALLAAPVCATILAQVLGYGSTFAAIGLITVTIALTPLLLMTPETRPLSHRTPRTGLTVTARQVGHMLKRPALLMIFGLISIGTVLVIRMGGPFLTLYLSSLGYSQVAVGLLLSLQSLSKIFFQTGYGRMARRVRHVYLLTLSILFTALTNMLLPAFTLPVLLIALLLVSGAFLAPYNPGMVSLVHGQFSEGERDLGMALWITTLSLTGWLAAPALGALSDAVGLAAMFSIASFLVILTTITLVGSARWMAQQENAPGEMAKLWR